MTYNRSTRLLPLLIALFLLLALPACGLAEGEEVVSTPVDTAVEEASEFGDTGLTGDPELTFPEDLAEEAEFDLMSVESADDFGIPGEDFDEAYAVAASGDYASEDFIFSFTYDNTSVWVKSYTGSSTSVSFPSEVEYNGVIYPVTEIGERVFADKSVQSVVIPASVNELNMKAFVNCVDLTSVTINGNIKDISPSTYDSGPFSNTGTNSGGYTVTFGNDVTRVPAYLFRSDSSLSNNDYAHVTSVVFSDSVTEIGNHAFDRCFDLENIKWSSKLQSIGESAFYNVSKLTELNLPSKLVTIGQTAFYGCNSLKTISLPASTNYLGNGAFSYCTGLTSVTINGNIQETSGSIPAPFYSTGTFSGGYSVTFGDSVTRIPSYLFYAPINQKGSDAYAHVKSVSFGNSVRTIGQCAFQECRDLESVTWSSALQTIDSYAFAYNESLTELRLPSKVTTIGTEAFRGCTGLSTVYLPDRTNSLSDKAFADCVNLTSVTINGNIESPSGYRMVFYNTGANSGGYSVTFGEGAKEIPAYLFYSDSSLEANKYAHVKSVSFPYHTETIKTSAFRNCYDLESISWGEGLKTIAFLAFNNDSSLKVLELPESLTTLGSSAFSGCSGVEVISLPKRLTSLGQGAFDDCVSLKKLTILGDIDYNTIGKPFRNTGTNSGGYSVTFGDEVTVVPKDLFYTDVSPSSHAYAHVTGAWIPDSVVSIQPGAFQNCYDLSSLNLGTGLAYVEGEAFLNCSSLAAVMYGGSAEMWEDVEIDSGNDPLINALFIFMQISTPTAKPQETPTPVPETTPVPAPAPVVQNTPEPQIITSPVIPIGGQQEAPTPVPETTPEPQITTDPVIPIGGQQEAPTPVPEETMPPKTTLEPEDTPEPRYTPVPQATPVPQLVMPTEVPVVEQQETPTPVPAPQVVVPTKIKLNKRGTVKLGLGKTLKLKAAVTPSNAQAALKWKSGSKKVARVDQSGIVTPIAPGTATITVTTANGKKASVKVKVTGTAATKVELNKTGTVKLKAGKKLKLKATLTPAQSASVMTWSSSNNKVAKVNAKGTVTALKPGIATITAKTANGKRAKVKIKVTK